MPGASAFLPGPRKTGSAGGTVLARFHPFNFLAHYMTRIVTAAVYADAEHICDGVIGLKQGALELLLTGATAA